MVLIAVPLFFQFLFVAVLSNLIAQAEAEVAEETHSKAILLAVDELYVSVLRMISVTINRTFGNAGVRSPENIQRLDGLFESAAAEIPSELKHLRELSAGFYSREEIEALESLLKEWVRECRLAREDLKSGLGLGELMSGLVSQKKLFSDANILTANLDAIRIKERARRDLAAENHQKSRELVKAALNIGISLNILLSIALASYFAYSFGRRIKSLTTNTELLAAGAPLLPMLEGDDEMGRLDRALHDAQDKIKTRENEIMSREEEIKGLLENMFVGLASLDRDGNILSINQKLREIYSYPEEELIGKNISVLFPNSKSGSTLTIENLIDSALERVFDTVTVTNTGEEIRADICLTEYRRWNQKYYLANFVIATERHKLESFRRKIVALITHELRTPLNSIKFFIELLARGEYGALSDSGKARCQSARTNSERMILLVSEILEIERARSSKLQILAEEFTVEELISNAVVSVQALAEKKDISFDTKDNNLELFADPKWLLQVLINLLANAIKHSPAGASITIAATVTSNSTKITVSDCGPGILKEEQELLFEPFFTTGSNIEEGVGLGLALCKEVIEQHGGSIGVTSSSSGGAAFWFTLPIGKNHP